MVSKKIADFAGAISFTVREDSAYGFINDFLVTVYETGTKKSFFIYYNLNTDVSDSNGNPVSVMTISSALESIFSKYEITEYAHKDNGIEITGAIPFKNFYSLMKGTVKILSTIKAVERNVCSECLKELSEDDEKYRLSQNGSNVLICCECSETFSSSDEQINEDSFEGNEIEGSVLKGVFGSILFSVGISICLILLYAFVIPLPNASSVFKPGYYVNWIVALMAFASLWGYRIFSKESISNKQILISGSVSIVVSIITQYISSIILFSRESIMTFDGLTFTRFSKMLPSLLKIPFTDSYTSPDFKIYLLMDLIFIVIVMLIASFLITPKTKDIIVIEEL